MPFTKTSWLEDRLKHLSGAPVKGVLHWEFRVGERVVSCHGNGTHEPHDEGHGQDDLACALHEGPRTQPRSPQDHENSRNLVGGKYQEQWRVRGLLREERLEDKCSQDHHDERENIEREDHCSSTIGEENPRDHQVDGQSRCARGVRRNDGRDDSLGSVGKCSCCCQ